MTTIRRYLDEGLSAEQRKKLDSDFDRMTYKPGKHSFNAPEKHPHIQNKYVDGAHHYVKHNGKEYSFTGKTGTHIKSGEKSFEYSHDSDDGESRVWVRKSGKVDRD